MNELVQRLSQDDHPIEASLRPDRTIAAFKESIDRGFVHIKFTDTQGGTELGIRLDPTASKWIEANFGQQLGQAHLVGTLTLNFVKVRCVADIELDTLAGKGHLEPVQE